MSAAFLAALTFLQLAVAFPLNTRSGVLINTRDPIVNTGYARYLGNFTAPFSVAYLGIPYAEPPVGNQRFRKPMALNTTALKNNASVIDARSYPNFCVQGSIGQGDAGGAGSEDCLKVNVYAPINATAKSNCMAYSNTSPSEGNVFTDIL